MRLLGLFFITVLLATACSKPITRAFADENVYPRKEILDVVAERTLIEAQEKRAQSYLSAKIKELKSAEDTEHNREQVQAMQTRLDQCRRAEEIGLKSFDTLHQKRLPGDHIFYVHSRTQATVYYVLIRGDKVIERTESQWLVE